MEPAPDPVVQKARVHASLVEAFDCFLDVGAWWPSEFTWSGDAVEGLVIERWEGGRCREMGPHGFTCDWGRVASWDPPRHLELAWSIGPNREPVPDPSNASRVVVSFSRSDVTCEVEIRHDRFERHPGHPQAYRDAMAAGWAELLERYRSHADRFVRIDS
jgi:uncharacterized protein YndB with AHSA1/START domain